MNLYLVKLHKPHDAYAFLKVSKENDVQKAKKEFERKYGGYGKEIIYSHMTLYKIDSVDGYKVILKNRRREQMDKCPWCGRDLIKADGYIECENYMCHYGVHKQREDNDE